MADDATKELGGRDAVAATAARRRLAEDLLSRHEGALRRTARRHSLCDADADDALQRALEIVLTKAPTEDPRELIRWAQVVTRHEASAVRRHRQRTMALPAHASEDGEDDWLTTLPSDGVGPAERAERREDVARSREALQALKPDERRALGLLGEGYSYAEISSITGFSATKVNRCLVEGRERYRRIVAQGESGERCVELRPLLSAFGDGELGEHEAVPLREHLRACGHCRATLRAYRAAPPTVAALAPVAIVGRSLLDRLHEAASGLLNRMPGRGGEVDATISQVAAAGGSRGAGAAAMAKLLTVCAGAAGGTACVTTGVVSVPLDAAPTKVERAAVARPLSPAAAASWAQQGAAEEESVEAPPVAAPAEEPADTPSVSESPVDEAPPASSGAVEYSAPPVAAAPAAPAPSVSDSGAGEFGP